MDIRLIEEVSEQSSVGIAIRDLIRTQLGNEQTLEVTLRQIGFETGRTLIVGGFVNDQLATMNAFMPHSFVRNGQQITGYQSGFSATGSKYRGKGYWPKLVTAGMELLGERSGHFVFGFPNPVSQPLFERKLNFDTAQMWRTVLPVFITRLIKFSPPRSAERFQPDLLELLALKAKVHSDLITLDGEGDRGFGKLKRHKGIRMIDIGGISSDDGNLNRTISRLARSAGAMLFRIEARGPDPFGSSFYPQRPSRPVIFKSLGADLRIDEISFVGGLSDDY